MAASEPRGGQHGRGEKVLRYRDADFQSVARALQREYPGHWIALEILDEAHSMTRAKVLSVTTSQDQVVSAIRQRHLEKPEAVIRFFSTDSVAAVS